MFLNTLLNRLLQIQFPLGFRRLGKVLKLLHALYSLRISSLLQYDLLYSVIRKLGLQLVPEYACLFSNNKLIMFFYIDDIIVLFHQSNRRFYDLFRDSLISHFKVQEIGELKQFLGVCVLRDYIYHKLQLYQDSYIVKIAKAFNLEYRKVKVPIVTNTLTKYDGEATLHEKYYYQRRVSSIAYLVSVTRPNISQALQKLSEFLQNPSPIH